MRTLFKEVPIKKDVVFTQGIVSKSIIDFLSPEGLILDPCKGDGAFFNCLIDADYCELTEGIDFLECTKKYDWIIGNPPYSIFEEFLQKAFELSENVSFLVPTNKVFQRQLIMNRINKYGGIKSIIVYGSGDLIGFPFGFSVGNFHFQRAYTGETRILIGKNAYTLEK